MTPEMRSRLLIVLLVVFALVGLFVYQQMQYAMRRKLRSEGGSGGGWRKRISFDWKVYFMFALTLLLAWLFARGIPRPVGPQIEGVEPILEDKHAYLAALYIIVVGFGWAIRQARKEAVSRRMLINQQVNDLVHSFRSVFRVRPTVFSALEESNRKIPPPVGSAVNHAVTTFYVTSLPRRALDELRARIENPYMEQLIYILERGEDAKHEDIIAALDGLMIRLRRARDLRDQSEVNMTVISGQTRIIQMIAVTCVAAVAALPMFRGAYENTFGQFVFMGIASVGVLTSWYIDKKSTELKEKVL